MDLQSLSKEELLNEFFSASDYYIDVMGEKSIFLLRGTVPYIAAKLRLNAVLEEMHRRKRIREDLPDCK